MSCNPYQKETHVQTKNVVSNRQKEENDAWWEKESPVPGLTRDGLVKGILIFVLAAIFLWWSPIDWNLVVKTCFY